MKLHPLHVSRVAAAAAFAASVLLATSAHAGDLRVIVDGVNSADGKVMVAMFDKASEFPSGKRINAQMAPAAKGAVTVEFKGVPPGRYALSAFHDVNGNGRLDANMVGMPTEPYGASRDARGKMGPPAFDDAVVTIGAEPMSLTIHLH